MTIAELMRDVVAALQADGPAMRYAELARHAEALADMVSWAAGVIDRDGRLNEHLDALQQSLRQRYEQLPKEELAVLHDALGDVRNAIVRHDRDLEIAREDDDEEFPT